MRTVVDSDKAILKAITPVEFLTQIVVKGLQDIGKKAVFSKDDIIALERLGTLILKIQSNNREEYAMMLKSGISGSNVDKNVLDNLTKLLLNDTQGEEL